MQSSQRSTNQAEATQAEKMIDDSNLYAPPIVPFYEEKPKKKKGMFSPYSKDWHLKRRAEIEAELQKPIEQRIGKLKGKADFTSMQLLKMTAEYCRKRRK